MWIFLRFSFPALVAFLAVAAPAGATSVDLVFDDGCTNCSAVALPNQPFTLRIVLRLEGMDACVPPCVFRQISFRIVAFPNLESVNLSNWSVECTPNPAATWPSGGGPFVPQGATISFWNEIPAQLAGTQCIELYRCVLTSNPGATIPRGLEVGAHLVQGCSWAGPEPLGVPLLLECPPGAQGPNECAPLCIRGGRALFDGTVCGTTTVQPSPWTEIKCRYR